MQIKLIIVPIKLIRFDSRNNRFAKSIEENVPVKNEMKIPITPDLAVILINSEFRPKLVLSDRSQKFSKTR